MKIIIEKQVVPTEEFEVKFYACEECDFKTRSDREYRVHFGNWHAVRKHSSIGKIQLYWFDAEEDANLWGRAQQCYDLVKVIWCGPTWYTVESKTEPCARGCCKDFNVTIVPACKKFDEMLKQVKDIMRDIKEFRKLIRELT